MSLGILRFNRSSHQWFRPDAHILLGLEPASSSKTDISVFFIILWAQELPAGPAPTMITSNFSTFFYFLQFPPASAPRLFGVVVPNFPTLHLYSPVVEGEDQGGLCFPELREGTTGAGSEIYPPLSPNISQHFPLFPFYIFNFTIQYLNNLFQNSYKTPKNSSLTIQESKKWMKI